MIEAFIPKSEFIGKEKFEQHAVILSGHLDDAVDEPGFETMTQVPARQRADNVRFLAEDLESMKTKKDKRQVLIWAAHAGFDDPRISTHLYNDSSDIERCIEALRRARDADRKTATGSASG